MNEEDKKEQNDKQELAFLSLIYSLSQAAWAQMGKIAHPVTNKVEKDFPQAKALIDMLRAIQNKTKGNLTAKEDSILSSVISDLELNYVEESNKSSS